MQKNQKSFIEATLVICAVLATICISAGMVALMAHNWDDFPKAVRLILSFVPLVAGIAVFYKAFFHHHQSKVWMESAATFLVLMTGSSIVLVTQLYHIGHFNQILLCWMLLSLPVLYLANSSSVAIVYLAGITWWLIIQNLESFDLFGGGLRNKPIEVLGYWLLVPAVIPHFMKFFRSGQQTLRTQILGWFSCVIILYGANLGFAMHYTVGYSLAITTAYVLGKLLFPNGAYYWNRPFQTIALLASTALVFFLSSNLFLNYALEANGYKHMRHYYYDNDYAPPGLSSTVQLANYVLLVALLGIILFLFIRDRQKEKRMNPFMVALPLVVAIGLLLAYSQSSEDSGRGIWNTRQYTMAKLWFNLYILGFCAYYLYKGIQMHINGIVTYAIFMLSILLLVRYIDMDIDFYLKGLIYIGAGAALLLFNKYYTSKTLGEDEAAKPDHSNTIDQL
jgi:uncharacterized membrane protein